MSRRVLSPIIALVVAVGVMGPVGYVVAKGLLGNAGAQETETAQPEASQNPELVVHTPSDYGTKIVTPEGAAVVPEGTPPKELVDRCERDLLDRPKENDGQVACQMLLLANEDRLKPGTYTDAEIQHIVAERKPSVLADQQPAKAEPADATP